MVPNGGASSGGSSGLVVGTTTVANGTSGYVLVDNNGVLGNEPTPGLIPAVSDMTWYVATTGNDSATER